MAACIQGHNAYFAAMPTRVDKLMPASSARGSIDVLDTLEVAGCMAGLIIVVLTLLWAVVPWAMQSPQ